jgi:hypothetical protein
MSPRVALAVGTQLAVSAPKFVSAPKGDPESSASFSIHPDSLRFPTQVTTSPYPSARLRLRTTVGERLAEMLMLPPKLKLKRSSNRARPRRFPSRLGTCRALGSLGAVATLMLLLPTLGSATIMTENLSRIFGDIVTATVTIDDESQAGDLVITLSVDPGPLTGDLRSFYAQVADESLLP